MKLPKRFSNLSMLAATGAVALSATAPTVAQARPHTTPLQRARAATVALSKVGRPYSWGATGPSSFDCSGLVSYAYNRARHSLGVRTSYEMWRIGTHVPRSRLRRGDIVFTWARDHGHVGIYLGRGRYVNAPGSGRHVEVAALPGGSAYVGAVRP
jgi:cell wall-associated NlpC family hydrolase